MTGTSQPSDAGTDRSGIDAGAVSNDAEIAAGAKRTRSIVDALGAISSTLSARDWPNAADKALASLGAATGVRRVFLFENEPDSDDRVSRLRHEWMADGVTPELGSVLVERISDGPDFGSLGATLDAGRPVILTKADVPERYGQVFEHLGVESVLVVPIFVDGERTGVLGFDTRADGQRWEPDEIAALSITAGILGTMIRHRRTLDSLQRRDRVLEAVAFAAERFLAAPRFIDTIDPVLARLGEATGATRVAVVHRGDTGDGISRMGIQAQWAAQGIAPLILSDEPIGYTYFPRWARDLMSGRLVQGHVNDFPDKERIHLLAEGVRSIVLAPIFVDGGWWGHVGFDDSRAERSWSEPEVEALRAAAGIVGAAIERERVTTASREQAAILRAIGDATTSLLAARDWLDALTEILRRLRAATNATLAFGYVFSPEPDGRLRARLSVLEPPDAPPGLVTDEFVLIPRAAARLRAGAVLQDESVSDRDLEDRATGVPRPTDSWIALPITVDGVLWGAIGLDSVERRPWSIGEIDALRVATSAIAAVVERGRSDVALRDSQEGLARLRQLDLVGRLAGGLAHDFGNVLTAIIGNAELMALGAHSEREREDAGAILAEARRGSELIAQLMSFSRHRVGEVVPVHLNDLVLRMERIVERLVGTRVELSVDLDPTDPQVMADPAQVEHILVNLATNARDAMPDGGRLTIATAVADGGRFGVLRVRDTGTGMDEATRQQIFEPLFTTKRESEGTGFGLATADSVVTQLQGRIDVDTALGVGTTFSINLPLALGDT